MVLGINLVFRKLWAEENSNFRKLELTELNVRTIDRDIRIVTSDWKIVLYGKHGMCIRFNRQMRYLQCEENGCESEV